MHDQTKQLYVFGPFRLDTAEHLLLRDGKTVPLAPKVAETLLVLIQNAGHLVEKDDLMKKVWPDAFVEEGNLNKNISILRKTLGQWDGGLEYIETVPKRGYRFAFPLQDLKPSLSQQEQGVGALATEVASVSRQVSAEPALTHAPVDIASVARPDTSEARQGAAHPPELQLVRESQTRAHRERKLLILAFSVAVVALCIYLSRYAASLRREPRLAQITANSADNPVTSSAISPDGKFLAFTDHSGRMRVRLLATGETKTVPSPQVLANSPADWTISRWFPDSTRFLVNERSPVSPAGILVRLRFGIKFQAFNFGNTSEERSVWTVSVLGGPPQKLRDDAEAFSVSPDGSLVAFGTKHDQLGDHEIWLMDSKGQDARKLLETPEGTALAGFSWSQDGQRAIYFRFRASNGELLSRDLKASRDATLVSFPNQGQLSDFVWLPDGRLIYSRSDNAIGRFCNLWEIRIDSRRGPVGRPRQFTNWSGFCAGGMSVTFDGTRLVFQRTERQTTVSIADLDANGARASRTNHWTLNEYVNAAETWTPDSRALVFRSLRDGHWKLFKQALDSDVEQPLVSGAEGVAGSAISPDGAWLFYLACGAAREECGDDPVPLMRIPISGGTPDRVLTSDTAGRPRCAVAPAKACVVASQSADGRLLKFTTFDSHGPGAEVARFETEPTGGYAWSLSPDGTRISVIRNWDNRIHILSLNRQSPVVITAKEESRLLGIYWAADGKGWFSARMSASGVVLLHVDLRGRARPIWEQKGDAVAYGMPSPDGQHLAIVATVRTSNVCVLDNF